MFAAESSTGSGKSDRQVGESVAAGRGELWLWWTWPRNFATECGALIVEGQSPDSGDRRLCKIDCAKAAGGGRSARKSHSGRVAVGGLHEFRSRRSDKCLSSTVPVKKYCRNCGKGPRRCVDLIGGCENSCSKR